MSLYTQQQQQQPNQANPNDDSAIQVQSPPTDGISSLSFSPQADFLAASSWDNQACLVNSLVIVMFADENCGAFAHSYPLTFSIMVECTLGQDLGGSTERRDSAQGELLARGACALLSMEQGKFVLPNRGKLMSTLYLIN